MENKKMPFKIVHLGFMIAGLCFYVYSITQLNVVYDNKTNITISLFQAVSAILALVSGFLYLVNGYKKNAAAYYKGYVWIVLIADMFATVAGITEASSYLLKSIWAVSLILLAILATGKDLGSTKSYTIAICILLCKVVLLVASFSYRQVLGSAFIPVILDLIAQIVLTVSTTLMVCGKYIDKESRGAK